MSRTFPPPEPKPATAHGHVAVKYLMRRFDVCHGYKGRETVQVRLEESGDIYLCHTTSEGRDIHSVTVPFDDFTAAFAQFVDQLKDS